MSPEKTKIPLPELTSRFNAFLREAAPGKEIACFCRDCIIASLGGRFESVAPPFPRLLPFWDRRRVKAYYRGKESAESFSAAHQEKEILVSLFARFLSERGNQRFILFSEAFYDDSSQEETKAFLLSTDYSFSDFMEEEALTALMAAADTILSTEDFSGMLVFFHHNRFELYDEDFAVEFRAYAARQRVALKKCGSGVAETWGCRTSAPGDPI